MYYAWVFSCPNINPKPITMAQAMRIGKVLIEKDDQGKLTYNIPSTMDGKRLAKFKERYARKIARFKAK